MKISLLLPRLIVRRLGLWEMPKLLGSRLVTLNSQLTLHLHFRSKSQIPRISQSWNDIALGR